MIITRLRGGLGNQMFQYALGRVISALRNEELKLDLTGYENQPEGDTKRAYRLSFFNVKAKIADPKEVLKAKYPFGIISKAWRAFTQKVLKRYYIDYHPEIFRKKHIPYLDGFFQSEKYFTVEHDHTVSDFRQLIKNDFELKSEFVSEKMKSVDAAITGAPISISIHIRRGDYVTNKTANGTQGVASIEYYEKAIKTLKEKIENTDANTDANVGASIDAGTGSHHDAKNPSFFVFSDGIDWVKENLPITDIYPNSSVIYVSSQSKSENQKPLEDYEELTLMSHCHHNIIANSSFSWWAAWLNKNPGKIVIAPEQWTVKNTENPNIIPSEWLRL